MFCPQCSADNPADANYCQKCGAALHGLGAQPANPAPPAAPTLGNAIWNPNAAANWSLLFSPAFGAYLHMLNWRALGQPGRAASAQHWFLASLTMLLVSLLSKTA
jgi:hypothetical protein